MSNFC